MTEISCRECKDWRACIGKEEGYLFAHLRFCPFQILWVLQNSETLHSGKWPPRYSPYEEPRKKQLNEEGYFVKPAIIIAEVEQRLEKTNKDGKILYAEAKAGLTLEEISDPAWDAIMFIKGWRRKNNYGKWLRQRRYRERKNNEN